MSDYSNLGLTSNLTSEDSLANRQRRTSQAMEEYVDARVGDINRPGGLSYYNTGLGRAYNAVVSMGGENGAFPDVARALKYVQNEFNGGKILIKSGTYTLTNEDIDITSDNVEIYGEDKETTVLKVSNNNSYFVDVLTIAASNVILSNFTMDGNRDNNTDPVYLIYMSSGTGVIFDNLILQNQSGASVAALRNLSTDSRSIISNCIAKNCDGIGFYCQSGFSKMLNSHAENCGTGFVGWSYNTISSCFAGTCTLGFVNLDQRTVMNGCHAVKCTTGFELRNAYSSLVGCVADECSTYGAFVPAAGNTIADNVFRSSGSSQIFLGTSSNAFNITVVGNNLSLGSSHGIELVNANANTITGNVISYGGTFNQTHSGIILSGASADQNVISSNRISNSGSQLAYAYREGTTAADYNLIHGNVFASAGTTIGTQGANSVVADNILL